MTFEQDKDETPVLFRKRRGKQYEGEITAVFPTVPGTYEFHTCTCYAHVGQHGSCDFGWYAKTRPATPEEYASLKRELESAPFGYRLKIVKRWTKYHDAARRAELNHMRSGNQNG